MKLIENEFDSYLEKLDDAYLAESYIGLMTKQKDKSIFEVWVDLSSKLQSVADFDGISFAEYFKYLKTIFDSRQSRYYESDSEQVDAHHIIPRNLKLLADDDLNNLIALTRNQHIEAHAKFLGCLIKSGLASLKDIVNASGAVYLLDKYKLKDDLTAEEFAQLKKDIAEGKRLRFLEKPYEPKNRGGVFGKDKANLTDTFTWIWADDTPGKTTLGWAGIRNQVEKKYGVHLTQAQTEKWSQRYYADLKNSEIKKRSWCNYFKTFPQNQTDQYKNHSEERQDEQPYIAFKCTAKNGQLKIDFNTYEYERSGRKLADKIAIFDTIDDLSKKAIENHDNLAVGNLPTQYYYNRDTKIG